MIEQIRKKLGERHQALVMGMSKEMKVAPGAVLSAIKTHGGDLSPGLVRAKISELELMQGNSGIGKALHEELIAYGVKQRELNDHLAILKYIRRKPLTAGGKKLAMEIHRFLWAAA